MERSPNERYHDRVSARYDDIYENDPYHVFCRDIAWRHLRPHLPTDLSIRALDAGCGTGYFGMRLLKSGFAVDFLDLSHGMLERARRTHAESGLGGEPAFFHADLERSDGVPRDTYGLIVSQGDILSFVDRPKRAARTVAALLRPGGVISASLDQRLAGAPYFLEKGDLDGLEKFCRTGDTVWLAGRKEERFGMHMFHADEARALFESAGLEVVSVIGRTVLPIRQHRELLDDPKTRRRLLALEERLHKAEASIGRASHLDVIARKPRE